MGGAAAVSTDQFIWKPFRDSTIYLSVKSTAVHWSEISKWMCSMWSNETKTIRKKIKIQSLSPLNPLFSLCIWVPDWTSLLKKLALICRSCPVCVLSLLRSINNECRKQRALDGSAKSFWQTKDHRGRSSTNRLKWIQQEMLRLCLHAHGYLTITNISIRTMARCSHLCYSVKWYFQQQSASHVVNGWLNATTNTKGSLPCEALDFIKHWNWLRYTTCTNQSLTSWWVTRPHNLLHTLSSISRVKWSIVLQILKSARFIFQTNFLMEQ